MGLREWRYGYQNHVKNVLDMMVGGVAKGLERVVCVLG